MGYEREGAAGEGGERCVFNDERFFGVFIVHYDAHQPVIDDLEARILTIRDSL